MFGQPDNDEFYLSTSLISYMSDSALVCIVQIVPLLADGEHTKLANQLLDAWRILQNEYEENLYDHLGDSAIDLAAKNGRLSALATIVLYDLVMACYNNIGEYRYTAESSEGKVGQCKLNVLAPQPERKPHTPAGVLEPRYRWKGSTTVDTLEFEDNVWEEGSEITHIIQTKDALGRLLDGAENFRDAALILARLCKIQVHRYKIELDELSRTNLLIRLDEVIKVCSQDKEKGWPIRKVPPFKKRPGISAERLAIWGGSPVKQGKKD